MRRVFLTLSVFALAWTCNAQEPVKINPKPGWHALILGNANYEFLPKIPSASQEASLIEKVLTKNGFQVMAVSDFRFPDVAQSTEQAFLKQVKDGDLCFIYFTGYAVQAFEETILLPVNFNPKAENAIQQGYTLSRLLQKSGVKVVALEASRPISVPIENVRSAGPAPPDLTELSQYLFASAAPPGSTVESKNDAPGLFTQALAKNLTKPGLNINEIFLQVKRDVAEASGQKQFPYAGNITSEVVLVPKPVVVETPKTETDSSKKLITPPTELTLPLGLPATNFRDREEYVWIPGGPFLMGCAKGDAKCEKDEKPQHEVTITHGFWMGRNEVQVGSYKRFVAAEQLKMPSGPIGDSKWKLEDRPMVNVSWQDAASYCTWIGGRLPTEAEWEYAARANRPDKIYPMNSFEESRDKANFYGKAGNDTWEQTAPVRKFDPNGFKLFDMSGNVWEWVSDWYADSYLDGPQRDPSGPSSGKQHVARGGSFDSDPRLHLRISIRKPFGKAANNIGFRCVMEDTPKTQKVLLGIR